jgi:hypothetical protein
MHELVDENIERVGNKGGYAVVFHEEHTSDAGGQSTELADKSKRGT